MDSGRIEGIWVSPASGEAMRGLREVRAFAGQGLEGDRFRREDAWGVASPDAGDGRQVTLVARESLDEIEAETGLAVPAGKSRRNLITSGVRLTDLVGQRFRVGEVEMEGAEVCQPCAKMGEVLNENKALVVKALVNRSGLRARIITSGTIRVGDPVVPLPPGGLLVAGMGDHDAASLGGAS